MQPKLFALTSDLFSSSTHSQTLQSLTLSGNSWDEAEAPITFYDMYEVILGDVTVRSNTVNSLFKIYYRSPAASITVDGGSYDSNEVANGAIFDLQESDSFATAEQAPSELSSGDTFVNFYVKSSARFNSNKGTVVTDFTQSGPKTSCLLITGSAAEPWYEILIKDSTFTGNVGSVTNDIFFDESVLSIEIDTSVFDIDIAD